MGKYIKKPKTTRDVAVMDVSQSSLGVRTRAKTLALQRLQSSAAAASPADYLELRSRRLEKPPLYRKTPAPKQGFVCRDNQNRQIEGSPRKASSGSGFPIGLSKEEDGRSTRESTPCSFIRASETITTPGSSTKQRDPSVRAQNAFLRNIPTAREMEEFFADAEQPQQRLFIEKYNFDIVNDVPLSGRYEWVKVMP
ncbi:hypothetical protein BUALT_Bualt02G0193200 [Buddleja alternifolia]|uniref:Cyclin-dependent kinase inhibitor n=1 Tax=Buddleja alternifolia TaxID=168488 RepID=A0AAV6Y1J1_9LAMI|nr:hypothetical protein BUALT_Bualt02G0193200 [Buddleja alternifolia]